jgi:hypothetical protein
MEGWKEDLYVPFEDTESGLNVYPLDVETLTLDWNVTGNIDTSNYQQHMPYRSRK